MFSEKQILAYRAIKAPEEMREGVMNQIGTTKKQSENILFRYGALAAALVLVVALSFVMIPSKGGAYLTLNGMQAEENAVFYDVSVASEMRQSPTFSLPIELKAKGKTELAVSHGLLVGEDGEGREEVQTEKDLLLTWTFSKEEAFQCTFTLKDDAGVTCLVLSYDPSSDMLRVESIEKNK